MKNLLFSLLVVLCPLSNMAVAAPQVTGKIKHFYVNNSGQVLFKLDSAVPAVCLDKSWPFQFYVTDTVAKEWFSLLITREATGKPIIIGYNGNNSSQCNIEYIVFIN